MRQPDRTCRGLGAAVAVALSLLAVPALASAHIERSSYWPDPAPDTAVSPAAGGQVPAYRPLLTALQSTPPGKTLVVCRSNSMTRLQASVADAQANGYRLRPMGQLLTLTATQAQNLLDFNQQLMDECDYQHIQPAVNAAGNNDRIVIMPGTYLEPASRAVPDLPAECEALRIESDTGSGAVSYRYQEACPNAQNLIAIIGRQSNGDPPQPALRDRRGIPDLGPCIRCNVQIEGSGVAPRDVVIDAGRVESGNGGPPDPVKDVGIRADRADGIYMRNFTVRHAAEHGVYVLESDGYALDRVKSFYNLEYGYLQFASDHGLAQDCETVGNGDAGIYPGGAPDSAPRLNQLVQRCDSHHNALGYSGTMGNSVHVLNNNFYDNTTGLSTDSFFAGGHPGYPQDHTVFEGNRIFSNNFNSYAPESDVVSVVPVPIGTGILIAGGNDNLVQGNWIYDNWRRGTMLIAVPDLFSNQIGLLSTSHRNRQIDNHMGISPSGTPMPNGVDFWWDAFPLTRGNCWENNGAVTTDPPNLAKCSGLALRVGLGDVENQLEVLNCASGEVDPSGSCPWFTMPPQPGSTAATAPAGSATTVEEATTAAERAFADFCELNGTTLTCAAFEDRLGGP